VRQGLEERRPNAADGSSTPPFLEKVLACEERAAKTPKTANRNTYFLSTCGETLKENGSFNSRSK